MASLKHRTKATLMTMYKNYLNRSTHVKAENPGAKVWLMRINHLMEKALYNPNLNNLKMAESLEISERELFRKVKSTTGLSPQKYFRQYRLRRAMLFLTEGQYKTVKEVSSAVGYTSVSYFILLFEKEFGKKPLSILKEEGWR